MCTENPDFLFMNPAINLSSLSTVRNLYHSEQRLKQNCHLFAKILYLCFLEKENFKFVAICSNMPVLLHQGHYKWLLHSAQEWNSVLIFPACSFNATWISVIHGL